MSRLLPLVLFGAATGASILALWASIEAFRALWPQHRFLSLVVVPFMLLLTGTTFLFLDALHRAGQQEDAP